jgi:hypothetical protein
MNKPVIVIVQLIILIKYYDMKKQKSIKEQPKLIDIILIAKFTDNKCRQLAVKPETRKAILELIAIYEGEIRAIEEPINRVDFEYTK